MQDYSKILIERGWRTRAAPNALPPAPSPKTLEQRSPEAVKLEELADSDVHERMESSAKQFGRSHARLFPLIGKRVWTPKGVGKLLSVFATQCEVWPDGAERTVRVRPEEVMVFQ